MRSNRGNKHPNNDVLWRPRERGEPVRFSLTPPTNSRPGGDHFYETFSSLLPPLNFEKGHIEDALKKSLKEGRPLLTFNYSVNIVSKINELLSEENVRLIVQKFLKQNNEFVFIGLIKNTEDYNRGLKDYVRQQKGSNFIVLRVNMFDEVIVMNQYDVDEEKSTAQALNAVLRNAVKSAAEDREEEVKFLKNYEHVIHAQRQ